MEKILLELENALLGMLGIIPNVITAIAIFIVGLILAKFLRKILATALSKTGIDNLADRLNQIDLISGSKMRIVPSAFLSSIVYYLVLFVFIMVSVEALGMEALSQLMTDIINYIPKAISALFVLIIGVLFSDMIKKIVLTTCESLAISSAKLIANFVFYFLFLNVALITLKQAELQTNFMENNISIIFGGIILAFAIGYGLASKTLMSNMLSAYYNGDKFQLDDELTIDGQTGIVIGMDGTSLTLRVETGEMVVPLSRLSKDKYFINRKKKFTTIDTPSEPEA